MFGSSAQEKNPFLERGLFVDTHSAAALAAAGGEGSAAKQLAVLASTPTAIWLTPEALPKSKVGPFVNRVATTAADRHQVPVFVVYGITGRDCSGAHSQGGLGNDDYNDWVREIAEAAGRNSVVIVEPDALATAVECGKVDERVALLVEALKAFAAGGPAAYLDAGHSDWIAPVTMADLLARAGIKQIRGFATNVSAYESEEDERQYAEEVSAALGGSHYVIDSGRNGLGSNGEWCNPTGRAVGIPPGYVNDGTGQDAYLWIKPPGESDGECNGGPPAGQWSTPLALDLLTNTPR